MSTDVRKIFSFLVIFDTCDVSYNLLISLLQPIVLESIWPTLSLRNSHLSLSHDNISTTENILSGNILFNSF